MTGRLSAAALLIGKRSKAAGLRAWLLPVPILARISGKKILGRLPRN